VRRGRLTGIVLAVLVLTGCVRGCPSSRPPIHPNPNMDAQPKARALESSAFFYDGAAMRPPVPGTVAREDAWAGDALHTGRDESGQLVVAMPVEADAALLERGADRYGIYCAPCHDARGNGRGILYERGNVPTPSFHDERLRALGDGEIYDVITNGKGLMPSYRWPLEPRDRWAVVAHVRELQSARRDAESRLAAAP